MAPGGATAATPGNYSGQFEGTIQYQGCDSDTPTNAQAGGTWSVRRYGDRAKATFVITVDSAAHVAYPYPGMSVAPEQTGTVFSIFGPTEAGLLTVTLEDNGDLTYTVGGGEDGYHLGDLVCDSVTYPGHLGD
jgi:hypothetical protein